MSLSSSALNSIDWQAPRRFNTDFDHFLCLEGSPGRCYRIYAVVILSAFMCTRRPARRHRPARARFRRATRASLDAAYDVSALPVSHLVNSFLFGVSATDPLPYMASVLIVLLMVSLASILPASRIASGDPIDALRPT
jgi:ABC-type antimicrobial peptide transport system permease subunit